MPGIIWLASYPKSGNTWLRAFLANFLKDPAEALPINDLPNHILGDSMVHHYERFANLSIADLSDEEIAQLRPKVHEWMAFSRGRDIFVKTHNMVTMAHGTPLITPSATAGAVYVIRNPLDVAVSFSHHFQLSYADAVNALCTPDFFLPATETHIVQHLGGWSRHVRSWQDARGMIIHTMRYEDMLRKPIKAFGSLIDFLQLPKDRVRLKKAIEFSSFKQLARQEDEDSFVEARDDGAARFFRSGKVGVWRDVLTPEQSEKLIKSHEAVMKRFGYLTEAGKLQGI